MGYCYVASVVSDFLRPHRRQPTRLPSPGFSRQEHWSGLPFPSPVHENGEWKWSGSVVSDSSGPMHCSPPGSSVHGNSGPEAWGGRHLSQVPPSTQGATAEQPPLALTRRSRNKDPVQPKPNTKCVLVQWLPSLHHDGERPWEGSASANAGKHAPEEDGYKTEAAPEGWAPSSCP